MSTQRKILLISGNRSTSEAIIGQLKRFLTDEFCFTAYYIDEECEAPQQDDYLTIFSSKEVLDDFESSALMSMVGDYIIATRSILFENLDRILSLPRDEDILLVNDSKQSAIDTIEHLRAIGFDFFRLVPYYPGCDTDVRKIKIAITPGEVAHVPQGLESVYNLGSRALDFRTIIRVLRYFDILEDRINIYIDAYANSMLEFARKISNVADETSKVAKTVRKELLGSGYYAKYRFEDIIGTSQSIVKMKKIAEKIAGTDLSVLIEGENGTGKELFASAIHNASQRAAEPFVAINLSALPDQLAESELFGYEEGAFTGAKKGGKIGLFQQAGGGTLFLDEIGDISLVMQGKLLRVLQEHEVMKVGGDRIIPVDVRIIAATNRNLKEMIKAGTFRQDLYYRLKECSIVIPALNQRREDIPLIAANWMKRKYGDTMELATDVVEDLAAQDWPGNVRELLNSLKFAVAVSSGNVVRAQDFPAWTYENAEKTKDDDTDEALMKMLSAVRTINGEGHIAGRAAVLRCIRQWDTGVTEYMVRKYIDRLIKEGLLTKNAGYGLGLTEKGNDKLAGTK